ncbi:MAG: tetratricopeptide repeat protein [Saprospiraceae bacterium]
MSEIHHSKNVLTNARIDANGNFIVGDGNNITVINLKEAAQYKYLKAEIEKLNIRFERAKRRLEKDPEDSESQEELIEIDGERTQKQKDLETLKREVIKLADEFSRIPLNTERLRVAKEHFDKGEIKEARAVLDAEMMCKELDALLYEKQKAEVNSQNLADKANEYLILARLTAINFDLPDRFEATKNCFEQSLKAKRSAESIFTYAEFLQGHNQYTEAILLYEEGLIMYLPLSRANHQEGLSDEEWLSDVASVMNNLATLHCAINELGQAKLEYIKVLEIYQSLTIINSQGWLPYVANSLSNLANLHRVENEFEQAELEYEEALKILKVLSKDHAQIYLPDRARILNNLGVLHDHENKFEQAESEYGEALTIYRELAETNAQLWMPSVGMTLNNLGALHFVKEELERAECEFEEALKIRRNLTSLNPQSHLPDLAITLNNLGGLHRKKNEFEQAEKELKEALRIRRTLATINSQTYLPDVATTLSNLAEVYRSKKEMEKAEKLYKKALKIRRYLASATPKIYLPKLASILAKMSSFYLEDVPDKEKSLNYCKEVLLATAPFIEFLPAAQNSAREAMNVISNWGEDVEAFFDKINEERARDKK